MESTRTGALPVSARGRLRCSTTTTWARWPSPTTPPGCCGATPARAGPAWRSGRAFNTPTTARTAGRSGRPATPRSPTSQTLAGSGSTPTTSPRARRATAPPPSPRRGGGVRWYWLTGVWERSPVPAARTRPIWAGGPICRCPMSVTASRSATVKDGCGPGSPSNCPTTSFTPAHPRACSPRSCPRAPTPSRAETARAPPASTGIGAWGLTTAFARSGTARSI